MTYAALLESLYAIHSHGSTKYKLDTMRKLCALFDSPEKKFSSIHIAGTNGKGSVTTKIAKALEHSGLKIGLYTSPHISCFRERIRLNGQMISEEETAELLSKIFEMTEKYRIQVSFFEITTLLAFCYYAAQKVDIAVIETGLGGRLDSTNIITPMLSVITSISLDHTSILGTTIDEIAKEKAGIIKARVPVVIGPRVPVAEISPIAERMQAQVHRVEGFFQTFDEENNAIAKKSLETLGIASESIAKGCMALPPCRLEKIILPEKAKGEQPLAIILDVAHNPDGLQSLFFAIKQSYPNACVRIVCGLSHNKEIAACVSLLKENGCAFHLVQANSSRALSQELLYQEFIHQGISSDTLFTAESIEQSMQQALNLAALHQEIVVVCGSFFIMAQIRAFLGIVEPSDPFELNEANLPIKSGALNM